MVHIDKPMHVYCNCICSNMITGQDIAAVQHYGLNSCYILTSNHIALIVVDLSKCTICAFVPLL